MSYGFAAELLSSEVRKQVLVSGLPPSRSDGPWFPPGDLPRPAARDRPILESPWRTDNTFSVTINWRTSAFPIEPCWSTYWLTCSQRRGGSRSAAWTMTACRSICGRVMVDRRIKARFPHAPEHHADPFAGVQVRRVGEFPQMTDKKGLRLNAPTCPMFAMVTGPANSPGLSSSIRSEKMRT